MSSLGSLTRSLTRSGYEISTKGVYFNRVAYPTAVLPSGPEVLADLDIYGFCLEGLDWQKSRRRQLQAPVALG